MCNTHTHHYFSHMHVIDILKTKVKVIFYLIIKISPQKCIGFRMLLSFAHLFCS
jgi:hypothetical protein